MSNDFSVTVLIVAAGSGLRMGGVPKQYRELGGMPVLRHSAVTFLKMLPPERVRVVISEEHRGFYMDACGDLGLPAPVIGGATRQASVWNGLQAVYDEKPSLVLIHDAARPFVSEALVARLLAALDEHAAVIPSLPVAETMRVEEAEGWRTVDRNRLRTMQTPQGFAYSAIYKAHRDWSGGEATDDGQVMEAAGYPVHLIDGDGENRKLTTPEDWQWATAKTVRPMHTRVGQGYDVHRFVPHAEGAKAEMVLGGVAIPHEARLDGHSDADAALHALTDALLGAAGEGDIGQLFPPSDMQWKGADSKIFLEEAVKRVRQKGGIVRFLDVTIVAEAPKIGPHREAMRKAIAEVAGVPESRVNVKATTSERMGFTGRREGLAALAIATLDWPEAA